MKFKRDRSPPNQLRYTFEDKLVEEMTSTKHAIQTSKMEFERDLSQPNQFRYTFEDKLEEEITSTKHASRTSKMEFVEGAQARQITFGTLLKTSLQKK